MRLRWVALALLALLLGGLSTGWTGLRWLSPELAGEAAAAWARQPGLPGRRRARASAVALALIERDRPELARELLDASIDLLTPEERALLARLRAESRPDQAARELAAAAQAAGGDPAWALQAGRWLARRGALVQAEEVLGAAVARAPDLRAEGNLLRGLVGLRSGELDRAEHLLQDARGATDPAVAAAAGLGLSLVYERRTDLGAAEAALEGLALPPALLEARRATLQELRRNFSVSPSLDSDRDGR